MVEDHEPGARGALVDGGDVIRHSCLSLGSGVLAQARALLADPMGGTLGLVRPPGLRDRALDLRAGPRLLDELALGDRPLDVLGLLQPGVQDVADEQVVEDDADDAADERPHDRYPEVAAERETARVVAARQGDLPP